MANIWLSFPFDVPADAAIVWVRIDAWSGAPFLAQYGETEQTFSSITNGIKYPVWVIARWRPQ